MNDMRDSHKDVEDALRAARPRALSPQFDETLEQRLRRSPSRSGPIKWLVAVVSAAAAIVVVVGLAMNPPAGKAPPGPGTAMPSIQPPDRRDEPPMPSLIAYNQAMASHAQFEALLDLHARTLLPKVGMAQGPFAGPASAHPHP